MADVELTELTTFTVVSEASSTSAFIAVERAHHDNPIFLGGTNTWIIGSSSLAPIMDELVIIDPGFLSQRHIQQLMSYGTIVAILLTHCHIDHIEAAEELSRKTSAPIYAGDASLFAHARVLSHGEVIAVGDSRIVAIHTPGHTADSFCFEVHSAAASEIIQGLVTGDTLLGKNSTPVDTSSGGNWVDYLETLVALEKYTDVRGFPGHGPVIDDVAQWSLEQRLRRLDRLSEARRRVVEYSDLTVEADIITRLAQDMYPEMPTHLHISVQRNIKSMLTYIEQNPEFEEKS